MSSSKSSSQANQSSTTVDKRIAGGDGSINLSGDGSTITVTDAGAVNAAFGFARDTARDAFDFATGSATRSNQIVGEALEGVAKAVDEVGDAYSEAKAGEQKVLVGMGLVVVGVVAVAALRGGVKL